MTAEYSLFIRGEDITPAIRRELTGSASVLAVRDEPGGWVRVRWRTDEIRKMVSHSTKGLFAVKGIKVYEADVDPVRRWITDAKVEIDRPRRCYLDIESDSRVPFARKSTARILCWAIVSEDGERRVRGVLTEDTHAAERELMLAMWTELANYDQVVAWNGAKFDFTMVETRSRQRLINIEIRRWLWLDHMVLFRRLNVSAAESGDEKQSLALSAVAKAVEAGQKLEDEDGEEIDGSQAWELWASGKRDQLADYCEHDADLMRGIESKTGYIELLQTLAESTYVFPDTRGINPTQQVEGFLLRLGLARTEPIHFRSHHYVEAKEQFRGAFVMDPTRRGILRDVHVCDFAGLYPSIILTWNMSPETWRPDIKVRESSWSRPAYLAHLPLKEFPLPDGHCAAAITDVVFANEPDGILPTALHELRRLRKYWTKRKAELAPGTKEWKEADRRATAYKIAANSFYGVIGSPFSRFFEREVAESVAQQSVWLIQETAKAAEQRGLCVVYGDTDSLFIVGCSRTEFEAFVTWCNAELYPRLLAEKKCTRNFIELAAEKGFARLVMVVKKRYAGSWAYYKGAAATEDSKPEIKGLEFKRGDTVWLARRMLEEVIHRVLGYQCEPCDDAEVFAEILDRYRDHILNSAELPIAEVVLSKKLSKPIRDYVRKEKKAPAYHKLVGEQVFVAYTVHECAKCEASLETKIETDGALFDGKSDGCPFCDGKRKKRKGSVEGEVVRVTDDTIAVFGARRSTIVPMAAIGELLAFAAQPAHVQVARMLAERGRDVSKGTRIEYVVLDGEDRLACVPAEDYTGELDRFYLWEDLVYPPTMRFLEAAFPGERWDRWERVRPIKPKPVKVESRTTRAKRSDITRQGSLFGDG